MFILSVIYAIIVVAVMLRLGWIGLQFKGNLQTFHLPNSPPAISAIVPARNEERNISRCAQGIMEQDYPADQLEMIFVNDASSDATPAILFQLAQDDPRLTVVHTLAKPDDWNGKQWACYSGTLKAGGEWLCFMDADTYAEPDLLRRTVAFALANQIDLLTLQPWYEMKGLWERIVMPSLLTPFLLIYPPGRVNNPDDDMVIANGQFILIKRAVYDAVGGHQAVRNRMMDDFPLAEITHQNGYRVFMADGVDVLRVRMYRTLPEIWAGAVKSSVDITGGWIGSAVGFLVYFAVGLLPVLLLIATLIAGYAQGIIIFGLVVSFQIVFHAVIRMIGYRLPPWSSVAFALGTLIILLIYADGMLRVGRGSEIKWKDRPVMR